MIFKNFNIFSISDLYPLKVKKSQNKLVEIPVKTILYTEG